MSAHNNNKKPSRSTAKKDLVQPISCGSILLDSNNDRHLFGNRPTAGVLYDSLVVISSFLRQHQFLSAGSSTTASASLSAETYGRLIEEFEKSQLERQAAGLRTNTNSASASDLQKIIDCHCNALNHGLNCAAAQEPLLTETRLKDVHAKLCHDLPQAGQYRDNRVRASNTLFMLPTMVREEMDKFILAVERFQTKFANSAIAITDEKQWVDYVYYKISIVAIIMFGVNDIHPFRDGNGRTSRIFMNMSLKRLLGLPFPVTVTAQVHQRREYVDALKESRSRLQRISKGENLARGQSVFDHMIEVVVDRVLSAVVQVNSLVEAKAHSAQVDEEARVARRVREKAAAGQCIICLDEHPNIATLCCGAAVHINCFAEWLSNQGSCITCRKSLPQITPRAVQRQEVPPTNVNDSNVNAEEEMTTTSDDNNDTTDTTTSPEEEETEEDATTSDNNDTTEEEEETTTSDDNDTTEDTTTSDDNNDTTEDSATEDTSEDTTEDNQPAAQSVYCVECQRNKFAVDCSNTMCGRCCQVYGHLSCSRHYC